MKGHGEKMKFTKEQTETAKTKLLTAGDRQKKAIKIKERLKSIKNIYFEKLGVNDFVCFIQAENHGIRIAYTINPDVTVQSLQRDYPDNYKILLVIPESNYNAVQNLHKRFERLKLKGSWYKPNKEIFDEIELFKATYPHVVGD